MAQFEAGNPALKVLSPPEVIGRFRYLMAWHPRMNTDVAHIWLRKAIGGVAEGLANP
jgi:hypothetical protein